MQFLLLFIFVAIVSADQGPRVTQDELARSLARPFRLDPMEGLECVRKTEVTSEDLQYMSDVLRFSDTEVTDMNSLRRGCCAVVCCAQKVGLMRGGEVQIEKLLKFAIEPGMRDDVETQLRNSIYICKEEVTDTSDECMAGFKFSKCVSDRMESVVGHR